MCDHRTCAPLRVPIHQIEGWVNRVFEMAFAVRRGRLPVSHLSHVASPAMAAELVQHITVEPLSIKAKLQWCKAEFLAMSPADPPAYIGSLAWRHGRLRMVAFQVLPPRRF